MQKAIYGLLVKTSHFHVDQGRTILWSTAYPCNRRNHKPTSYLGQECISSRYNREQVTVCGPPLDVVLGHADRIGRL
jgi:hypothetical protein